jgi:hypothetical protein
MKKNIVLAVSFVLSVILVIVDRIGTVALCGGSFYSNCIDRLFDIIFLSVFIFPIFFFSLLTFFLKEAIFRTWLHFSYWWIPLSIILILISDPSPGHLAPSLREMAGMVSFGLYVIISLGIIIWKWVRTHDRTHR